MPHPAVGIGLGVLAVGAVSALVAKEVIDHWDEIQDKYEDFADRMEDEHNLHLPRFRQQRRAHVFMGHNGRSAARHSNDFTMSQSTARSSARDHFPSSGLSARSRPFSYHEHDGPANAVQDRFSLGDEDEDMMIAIEASLRDSQVAEDSTVYEAPDYPKAVDRTDSATPTIPAHSPSPSNPFEDTEISSQHENEFDSSLSETWTVTDASEQSPDHAHSDHEWSDSEVSYDSNILTDSRL